MTKPKPVVSVPSGTPRRPTKEECFDRFELVARRILPLYEEVEDEDLPSSDMA